MLSMIAKNLIVRALQTRRDRGENPETVLAAYKNLTEEEKKEILREVVN